MVRPEGVEPPAFWFVAKRSIQLSYGRTLQKQLRQNNRCSGLRQASLCDSGCDCRLRLRRDQRNALDDVETGAAQQFVHGWFGEAGSVVLDADSLCGFVKVDPANAVHLANVAEGHHRSFGGWRCVAVHHIKLRHAVDFSSGGGASGREFAQEVDNLRAGPVLCADELAAYDA